jgi:DNA adenine methylase
MIKIIEREEISTYIEPFVGSGAVFFWVKNQYRNIKNFIINDINTELTNTYKVLRDQINPLVDILLTLQLEYHLLEETPEEKKQYYLNKRKLFNSRKSDTVAQSALFIFLNKTCFNGLYRVNRNNGFNVPIGSYKKPLICDKENLILVHNALQDVEILNVDYEHTLGVASNKSLFYFDPPYKPLSATSNFNSYAKDNFDDAEQRRLAEFCRRLDESSHHWILSNSDMKNLDKNDNFFDDLYSGFKVDRVSAKRSINSKGSKRGDIKELMITNFELYR